MFLWIKDLEYRIVSLAYNRPSSFTCRSFIGQKKKTNNQQFASWINPAFFKAAWEVVSPDIMRVFQALWELDFPNFNDINTATMVLIGKTLTPQGLRDYRPISLIHAIGKLFAKGPAMRLAPMMSRLTRANQTAFIQGRRIHDNFRTVQLTCRYLHARRFPAVLLKIDLAKAFDTVAWPFLLEVLQWVSFPARWREWISAMLRSASTRILINGRPGQRICNGVFGRATRCPHCSSSS